MERYRGLITLGAAVVGVLIIGFLFFQSSARGGYECDTLLQPGATDPPPPLRATPAATPGVTAGVTAEPPTNGSPAAASPSPATSPPAGELPSPGASPDAATSPSPGASPDAATSPSPGTSPDATTSPSPGTSPTASPSPAAAPTPRLGFTTTELGRQHVRDASQRLTFAFCPPTSGDHFNVSGGVGPIRAQVYPPTQEQNPGGWVHNLEHGYIVALYRCPTPEDCASDAERAELQRFFDEAPDSPVAQNCPDKVVVARFDQMSTRFAFLAWNRALLMDELDLDTALTFAEQWIDHEAVPERGVCG